jgi:protein transport protein SEC31
VTLESVSTADVAPDARPVVASLGHLYASCVAAAAGNAAKKRELDDSSKKLGALFWRMNKRDVSPSVQSKLTLLCAALDKSDFVSAGQVHQQLTAGDWDEAASWLPALKRLMKARSG